MFVQFSTVLPFVFSRQNMIPPTLLLSVLLKCVYSMLSRGHAFTDNKAPSINFIYSEIITQLPQ